MGGAAGAEYAQDIALAGTTAYVAAGSQGVRAVDVADRARPRGVSECCARGDHPLAGSRGLAMGEGFAVVADTQEGVIVAALPDNSGPTAVARLALPGEAPAVALVDTLAHVLVDDDTIVTPSMRVLDRPEIVAQLAVPPPATASCAETLLVGTGDVVWQIEGDVASQLIDLDGRAATSMRVDGVLM